MRSAWARSNTSEQSDQRAEAESNRRCSRRKGADY